MSKPKGGGARGPAIKPIEGIIHEEYDKLKNGPNLTAKKVAESVRKRLNNPKWPGNSVVSSLMKEWRSPTEPDERDYLWSYISMYKYPIQAEALPTVLEAWALAFRQGDPLTIRQALWVSKLYYTYMSVNMNSQGSGIEKPRETTMIVLLMRSREAAEREKIIRFEDDNYPANRKEILYYWLTDSGLHHKNPESNTEEVGRTIMKEFVDTYIPDT